MTAETRERWTAEYPALTKSGDQLTDHMTARAEAQVIRLALIYALLDQAPGDRGRSSRAGAGAVAVLPGVRHATSSAS